MPTGNATTDQASHQPEVDWVEEERTKRSVSERLFGADQQKLRLGHFVVLGALGYGAMGRVYLVHDPKLDRRVALKLITAKPGERDDDAAQRSARLVREARAIAKLSHPNVVTVFETGTVPTLDGEEVFIAMEFIDGCTLLKWQGEHKRTWREVVDVYSQAGQGLAAAHQAEIVHRDFKPENVLCGADGRARVVDFGLAGGASTTPEHLQMTSEEIDVAVQTRSGVLMGTPAYMAPECFRGDAASASSDQFSFCAALYEALYGVRPFEAANVSEMLAAVLRAKPRVPDHAEVPGWLSQAVIKGLSDAPSERWSSMTELLSELRRDPQRSRRRAALLGGGALAAACLGALVATKTSRPCAPPDDRLAGVWDSSVAAQVEAAFQATQLGFVDETWVLVDAALDDYAQGWRKNAVAVCRAAKSEPAEVALLRARCIGRRLSELRQLTSMLVTADAQTVEKASEASDALTDSADCLDLGTLQQHLAAPPKGTASKVEDVRQAIAASKVLGQLGKYDEAQQQAHANIQHANETAYLPLMAEAQAELGHLQGLAGDEKSATKALAEAFWLARRCGHEEVQIDVATGLAGLLGVQGHLEDSQRWAQGAAADLERTGGSPRKQARLDANLGDALSIAGQPEQALEHLRAALVFANSTPGRERDLAVFSNKMGAALHRVGRYDAARQHYQRALNLDRKRLGSYHPQLGNVVHNLARLAVESGDNAQARTYLQQALELWTTSSGEQSTRVAAARNTLGVLHTELGEYRLARAQFLLALPVLEAGIGENNLAVGTTLYNLAYLDHLTGDLDNATRGYARAVTMLEATLGPDNPAIAGLLAYFADALLQSGRQNQASALVVRAVAMCSKDTANPVDCVQSQFAAAMLASAQGDQQRARQGVGEVLDALSAQGNLAGQKRVQTWAKANLGADEIPPID